ncbi:MAG TPA: DUF3566 domain-containing protein [Nocardioidaceae bacterium]|jgi:hypothetical protein|nr:DUF3566 domain-containing protein [Nocardioidaceae bacterium]
MADRRADDTPLAPRRPLSGPAPAAERGAGERTGRRGSAARSMSERVSSAVRAAGTSASSGQAATATREREDTGRIGRPTAGASTATGRSGAPAGRPRGTRRARLRLVHLDPWSVMKTSFLLSIALGIVIVVAVAVVWSVLGAAGVWTSINQTVTDVVGGDTAQNFDVQNYVGTSRVLGFAMIVAVLDVLLITAISTLAAFLYNLAAALLGGIEVTLAEDER